MPGKVYDTIIIGGGISGLTAAYLLHKQGKDVLVLEKESEPGGNIRTIHQNGARMETGPHSFMGGAEYTWKLTGELDIHHLATPSSAVSKNRYIYRHEKLKALPMSPGSFLFSTLLSPIAKFRLMLEPFIPNGAREDDRAIDFFVRRFGKEAATYIMTPFISGVYAGDVNILGARAAFAKFWQFEKDAGSMIRGAFTYMKKKRKRLKAEGKAIRRGLWSYKGGLGTLTGKLAEKLGDHVVTNISVEDLQYKDGLYSVNGKKARSVVIATPPPATGMILQSLLPQLNGQFQKIPMSPVSVLHWQVDDPENSYPAGFGFLMPRVFDLRVLGTLFPSQLFDDRIEKGRQLFVSFYGGMTDPAAMDLDDETLTSLMIKEHRRIFKRNLDGLEILRIIRYPGAIPQLLPDHPERIDHIEDTLGQKTPGLFLAGNYLTGVGIEHAVESGFHAFESVSSFLPGQHKNHKSLKEAVTS